MTRSKPKIGVFVLGPLDHSPRMLNHTFSLAEFTKFQVDFVGYRGSSMTARVKDFENINIVNIDTSIIDRLKNLPRLFYLFYAIIRIFIQILQLFYLVAVGNYDYILMQNPPCVPILMVVVVYRWLQKLCFCKQTKLIIDWHNYGYTIMQSTGVNRYLCGAAEIYEKFLGQFADQNLCVSKAFKNDLVQRFGIDQNRISVLYDRAVRGKFKILSDLEKHQLFERVDMHGIFTVKNYENGQIEYKENRPLLLLTSTSYTPDEDLDRLVDAMKFYAAECSKNEKLPKIHLIVTGAGPLKKQFIGKFQDFNKNQGYGKVMIQTKWLEIDDYPKMVAAADLGVCMHMSSSNLDLPMKVVDMFSSNLPCFAFDYPTISELVKSSQNGFKSPNGALFKTSEDLFQLFLSHFGDGLESAVEKLNIYRKNLGYFQNETWDDHWKEVMLDQKIFEIDNIVKK